MAFPDRRTLNVLLTTLLFVVAVAIVYVAYAGFWCCSPALSDRALRRLPANGMFTNVGNVYT